MTRPASEFRMPALSVPRSQRTIAVVSASVCVLGGLAEWLRYHQILHYRSAWAAFFSLSYEQNLPTFYSCVLLLGSALLLALMARSEGPRRARRYWQLLSAGFVVMSLDEMAELHERLIFVELDGVLHFSWVLTAMLIVLLLAAAFVPFLWRLEKQLRRRCIASAVIYLAGAVLMELPLGYWAEQHGSANLGYALIDWLEESLEIGGVSLFVGTLLHELARRKATFGLLLETEPPA